MLLRVLSKLLAQKLKQTNKPIPTKLLVLEQQRQDVRRKAAE